jgi:hypothetical protein
MGRPMASTFSAPVVGVTFAEPYPDTLLEIGARLEDGGVVKVMAVHDLNNSHDPNAVELWACMKEGDVRMGYLPAAIAERMAPELDDGTTFDGEVEAILVSPQNPTQPGARVRFQKII